MFDWESIKVILDTVNSALQIVSFFQRNNKNNRTNSKKGYKKNPYINYGITPLQVN